MALVVAFQFSLVSILLMHNVFAFPLHNNEAHTNHVFKRTYYVSPFRALDSSALTILQELYCPAVLPNPPPAPLVHSLNMRVVRDDWTDELILRYDDPVDGYINDLYTPENLCDRVGCHCDVAQMICSIGGTRWYNSAIHAMFIGLCTARCRCEPEYVEPPEPVSASDSDTDTTWSSTGDSDSESDSNEHFAHNVAVLRKHYVKGRHVEPSPPTCVHRRQEQCDSCLAGSGAGWTWRQSDCCSGYDLKPITPQELSPNTVCQ